MDGTEAEGGHVRAELDIFEVREPVLVRTASTPRATAEARIDPEQPLAGIRELGARPLLRQAVEVASGSLGESLRKLSDDRGAAALGRKRTLSAARTLTRYARRSGGRPTPFGLFAGVGRARFGEVAKTGPAGPGRVSVRLDGGWLHRRVLDWLAVPGVRRRVDVVLDDLAVLRDGRLTRDSGGREVSVRDNAVVAAVRAEAARPVGYAALLAHLTECFPAVGAERLDGLLAGLVRHGFLQTSLTPHRIDAAHLDRIEAAVEGVVPGAAEGLRAVRAAAAAHERDLPGGGRESWRALLAAVRALDPSADGHQRPPVQVDLTFPGETVLPASVGEEVRRYAAAVWAMTPEWGSLAHLRDYRDRFVERYGTASAVPLADLVDPHRGLGLPPEYTAEDPYPRTGPGAEADRPRRAAIAELVQQAVLEGGELVLTDADVQRIGRLAEHDPSARPPRTLELCFQLLADGTDALDRGEYLLLGSPHIGSWTAGATAGRFAEATGLTAELARLVAEPADQDALLAQLEIAPRDPRSLNIVQVPRLLPHRIPVGLPDDRTDPHCLDWRTLLVAAGADGLRLLHGPTGRQVVPVLPHMLALDAQAPPVARFLVELAAARPRVWTGWDWAGLDTLPYLPAVRYGRVLVSPARWLAGRRLREAAATADWERELGEWRRRYRVPDRLQIARNDQMYPVDLREPWDRELLRAELTAAQPRFVLYQDLTADPARLGWNSGHATEIVVPLARAGAPAPRPPEAERAPLRPAPRAVHLPGEEWLYLKLYAEPGAHDALVATHLPALLAGAGVEQDVDRWFFLRYRDPEPHVRLRLHGADPQALHGRVLPALARGVRRLVDSGAVRTLQLDTYRPETDRYGGEALQEAAERLFLTDSRSAMVQLAARRAGAAAVPDEVLAAFGHGLLLSSLGEWDWCSWVDEAFTKGPDHELYQRHRALADGLLLPGGFAAACERLGMPGLAELWSASEAPRAYGELILGAAPADRDEALHSLLHMRHNRLFGTDPAAEARGYAVLRGAARTVLGRRRTGRAADFREGNAR
ncbi:lantibiotic dehydratase [Kitasatospora sp. NPDC051853]|uniref:lantibiotic dehydratase n=1 Tax=Kitasatospora sp. NPDC051853 TaxID=3364058 RepID=UPI0037980E74